MRQDLVVQTDDSYLKIARRLDEYRTNAKTQFLPVCAAGPLHDDGRLKRKESRKNFRLALDRPSERRGFSLDPRSSRTLEQKTGEPRRRTSRSTNLSPMNEGRMYVLFRHNSVQESINGCFRGLAQPGGGREGSLGVSSTWRGAGTRKKEVPALWNSARPGQRLREATRARLSM